jgi:hypothetical protein
VYADYYFLDEGCSDCRIWLCPEFLLAPGVEFERRVKSDLLSVRVYNFIVSKGSACLRDVYESLDERPCRVDNCLRRLWTRGLILRTREPSFEFETNGKGRAGVTGNTRAINYYIVNNNHDVPASFVSYDDRKQSAEVDRVWKVTPGLSSPTVTYVLECRWSIITRKTLDDFIEVLKWPTDFGVDTENGRELKKGVVPVFAAGTYKIKEMVTVNGERITLAQYASRMNVKLLRLADFNSKLRERGVDKTVTVQSICRVCSDEKQIRNFLDDVWNHPSNALKVADETLARIRLCSSLRNHWCLSLISSEHLFVELLESPD